MSITMLFIDACFGMFFPLKKMEIAWDTAENAWDTAENAWNTAKITWDSLTRVESGDLPKC